MPYKKQRKFDEFDDTRGPHKMGGWWINEEEAMRYASRTCKHGEQWWKASVDGKSVELTQHDENGPLAKCFWRYENGDMYLGEWRKYPASTGTGTASRSARNKNIKGTMVEHGFGVTYNHYPAKLAGLVCVGEWQNGKLNGKAQTNWMKKSKAWETNYLAGSEIFKYEEGNDNNNGKKDRHRKKKPFPYTYLGKYSDSMKNDSNAYVVLKDGTFRIGPWENGKPVGDWWQDHKDGNIHLAARPRTSSASSSYQGTTTMNSSGTGNAIKEEESVYPATQNPVSFARIKRKGESDNATPRQSIQKKRNVPKHSSHDKTDIETIDLASSSEDEDTVDNGFESMCDQSQIDTGHVGNAEESVDTNCAMSKNELVKQIEKWLTMIFGGISSDHAQAYAGKFYDIGAYPPSKFVEVCTVDDIQDFTWMLQWHRKIFEKWLMENH